MPDTLDPEELRVFRDIKWRDEPVICVPQCFAVPKEFRHIHFGELRWYNRNILSVNELESFASIIRDLCKRLARDEWDADSRSVVSKNEEGDNLRIIEEHPEGLQTSDGILRKWAPCQFNEKELHEVQSYCRRERLRLSEESHSRADS